MATAEIASAAPEPMFRVSNGRRYWTLGLFFALYAFAVLDRNIINLALDDIKADMHFSDTELGLVAGFGFSGIQLLVGIPAARWADRSDRRLIITLAVALWSAMTVVCATAASGVQFVLGRIGVGVGESTSPAYHSMLSDLFTKNQRGRAIAVFALGAPVATLVGFPLMGLVQQAYGWRTAFLAAGLPGLLLALVVFFTVRDPRGRSAAGPAREQAPPLGEAFRTLFDRKSFMFVMFGFALGGFGSGAFNVWGPTFLARVHHLNPAQIGASLGMAAGLAGLVGGICGGVVVDLLSHRYGDKWKIVPIAITSTLKAPTIFLIVFAPWLEISLAGIALLAFFSTFEFAPIIAVIQSILPRRVRALGSSVNGFVGSLIALGLGPLFVGMVNDYLTPTYGSGVIIYSIAAAASICLLGAASLWLAARFVVEDILRNGERDPQGHEEHA
ncbi:MAG TPA: MFS transporter [Sphingomonadaceae bacterium]|nr:MFS transporter [Sphingomonadaceae bacterium]